MTSDQRLRRLLESQVDLAALRVLYPSVRVLEGQGVRPRVRCGGREYLVFCSNDYLDLACDFRLIEAAKNATEVYGVGALPSRVATGILDIQEQIETKLAKFIRAESCLTFTSGTAANTGTVPALIGSPLARVMRATSQPASTAVFADAAVHASLIDGIRLAAPGRTRFYRHVDMGSLKHVLEHSDTAVKLIVTDGVFSVDGDIAPLPEIAALAEEHDAAIMVDDAHGTGVLGECGRGSCELLGAEERIDVRMGSLSKALGCIGGFIAGPSWFIEYLRHAARTSMFSMPLPAAAAAAISTAVDIVEQEPWRRKRLLDNARYLRDGIQSLGFGTAKSTTHIVPVVIGDEEKALSIEAGLQDRGILVRALRYPAAAKGQAALRLFANTAHTREDMDYFLNALADVAGGG